MADTPKLAVLAEHHPYDVVGFRHMLDSFGFDYYVQPFSLFAEDEINRRNYDSVLWYNMNWDTPPDGSVIRRYMENEIGCGQGIVLLHHALLSFQDWDLFTDVCGLRHRGSGGLFRYTQNEIVEERIVSQTHPITAGVSDFTVTDETYTIGEPQEPGNQILITTNNPTSIKSIAWVRKYKQSRVFCYASGHDNKVYANQNFRNVLRSGILWSTGK